MTENQRTCPLGIRWSRGAYGSKFGVDEVITSLLFNAQTQAEILEHRWPTAKDFDFSPLHEQCEQNTDKVIIGGLWTGIMGDSYRMYGFENFLLNIAMNPPLIKTLIDRMTEMYLELNDAVFKELEGKMDVWFFGNDFGSQSNLLISVDMWLEFFYKNICLLCNLAHSYGLKVMMHSCGAISPLISHLIAAGVEILDPIQITANGMEPNKLVQQFGGKIVFHGGIDTQHVLPHATSQEVTCHTKTVMETFNKKGGYLFAPSQILGPDIPIENIVAMYQTQNNIGRNT